MSARESKETPPGAEDARAAAEPQTDLRAATVHGLRWISTGRAIVEVMMMGSLVVLARLIPPAAFGPYAVAIVVQDLAISIQGQGVSSALVQRATVTRAHLQAGQALGLICGIVLTAATWVVARTLIPPVFGDATASLVALASPLFVVYALGTVPFATLRRRFAFRGLSLLDIANTTVRLGSSIGLAAAGLGARSLIIAALAGGIVFNVGAWLWAPPPLPWLRRGPVRDLLDYGVAASLAAVSWVGFRNCDYAIIGARAGALQSGFYFRAYTLAVEYQKKVSDVMTTVAFPVLSRSAGPDELHALRGQMVRVLTAVLFPLLALLAITAPVLIPWLLGSDWTPVVVPAQILAAGGASTLVIDSTGVVLMSSGRSRAMLWFGVGHFLVYGLVVWFVAVHGIAAVAVVAAVVHTAFVLVAYRLMVDGPFSGVLRHLWADVGPATVSSVALALVAVPLSLVLSAAHTPALAQLVAVAAAAGGAYVAALALMFTSTWRELVRTVTRVLPAARLRRRLGRARAVRWLRAIRGTVVIAARVTRAATWSRREALAEARGALRDHRHPLPVVRRSPAQLAPPAIYFCAPDFDVPSGGVRVIYRHVDLLNRAGIPAYVLHRRPGFRCTWFEHDTAVVASDEVAVGPEDLVVVGELAAPLLRDRARGGRFVVFNQNPHLTWQRVPESLVRDYVTSPDLAAIVVVSDHSLEMVGHLAPGARVARVHNSIDPRLFHPGGVRRRPRLTYMPRGGRDEAEQVLGMLRARGVLDGWEVVALQGLTEREVAECLRATTIFVSFAYHEGFGLPAAEAMACGAYVVGFHGFAGREFMRPEFSEAVGPGDVLELAQVIERAVARERAQPGWCETRGALAAAFVAREYSPARERDEVVSLYRGLLGAPRPPGAPMAATGGPAAPGRTSASHEAAAMGHPG